MRKFASIAPVLALVLFTTGCPDAADYAATISASLRSEQTAYQLVRSNSANGARGDQVTDALQRWASAMSGLTSNIDNLSDRLRRHPEERSQIQGAFMAQLQTGLDAILSRDDAMRALTPSWRMGDAATAVGQVSGGLASLRTQYRVLFETNAPGRPAGSVVEPVVDSRLYDTYQDCVNQFAVMGAAIDDESCERYARNICSHQMRLISCVAIKILTATVDGRRCSAEDCDTLVNGPGSHCSTVSAPWMAEVRSCASTTPIEGPAN